MDYPVGDTLDRAIRRLFDDPSIAYGLLGQGIPLAERDVGDMQAMDAPRKVNLLRLKLESFIAQMASELDELGDDELPRLRAEATALLLALREIQNHFPEAIDSSKSTA